jgi:hypothetical protein
MSSNKTNVEWKDVLGLMRQIILPRLDATGAAVVTILVRNA